MKSTSSTDKTQPKPRGSSAAGKKTVQPLMDVLAQALRKQCLFGEITIPLAELRKMGMSAKDVKSLVAEGLVETWEEAAAPATRGPKGSKSRKAHSSVIGLTPTGVAVVLPSLSAAKQEAAAAIPQWNVGDKELWWRARLVKKFKRHAPYQFAILSAFEAQKWPARIDNPLLGMSGGHSKKRLYETLESMRRCQEPLVLHFHVEEAGGGICWEAVP